MATEEKYVLIANGGYLQTPLVERFTISEDDEEFMDSGDEFDDFDEYRNYVLEEAAAELHQKCADVLIVTEAEFNQIKTQ